MSRILSGVVVLLLLAPVDLVAQDVGTGLEHEHAITANPFLLLGGWFNVEYEQRFNPTVTWGLSGSLADLESFEYRSAKFLVRYYPQERALSGLFLGGRTGVYHVDESTGSFLTGTDSESFFAVGVELGYTWLLGSERHFAISIGGGLSRLFGGDLEDAPLTIPTVRLVNVGAAF